MRSKGMKYQTSQPRDLDHQPPRTAQICALRHLKRKNDVEAKEANTQQREVQGKEHANSMKEHAEEEEQKEEYEQQENGQPDIPHHTATSSRACNLYA
jgi:hypothetical protein